LGGLERENSELLLKERNEQSAENRAGLIVPVFFIAAQSEKGKNMKAFSQLERSSSYYYLRAVSFTRFHLILSLKWRVRP